MDPNYVRDEENEDEIMRGIDAHKYRGSLKSSLGSITQIYSLTRWEHKNTNKTLAIEASLSTTPVYQ